MKDWKLFYGFQCPLGAPDSKIGITGHPEVRLGVYQNSYSRNSHIACLNVVYVGPAKAIANLEKVIKQRYDWSIERDGRGASEWVSNTSPADIEQLVDELIAGFKFKIVKVDKQFLSLTVDNMEEFKKFYNLEQ
jgi:hypothetical protein